MRDITYPPIILLAKTGFRALGLTFQLDGTENIPATGGAVLACNHIGYLDFIFSGYAAQPAHRLVRFMAKREVFDNRISGPLMRSMHHISVDREAGSASYRTALQYLKAGEIVGIFPEATISRSFELKEFKTGATRLAAAAKVPLIPMVLWGTHRIYTKDHPRDFSRGKTIAMRVGEPLFPSHADDAAELELLKKSMASLLDETITTYPDREPGAWWMPARYGGTAPTMEQAAALEEAEKRERAARRAARGDS